MSDSENAPENIPEDAEFVSIQLVDQLESPGPFDPPLGFSHGPEFDPDSPRPIPRNLKQGSYAARRRNELLAIFVSATYCLIMANMSYIQELAYYVLPLGYLNYIGLGLAAIGVIVYIARKIKPGDYNYVKNGVPTIGRILRIERIPGSAEVPNVFSVQIAVEYKDPRTGTLQEVILTPGTATSSLQFNKEGQPELVDQFEFAFAPGDYVTLVGLPGDQYPKTLRIYGLLGLDPEREFSLKKGQPSRGMPPYQVITIITVIVAAFALLMGVIYVVEFYWPIGGNWLWAAIPGGIAFAIGLILGAIWAFKGNEVHSIIDRLALAGGCGMFMALLVLEVIFLTNALLDNSQSRFEPIRVVDFWQTTHNGIFRDYSIEYRPLQGGESEKIPADVRTMASFSDKWGAIEISDGLLGLTWRRGVRPLVWLSEEVEEVDPEKHILIKETPQGEEGNQKFLIMRPILQMPDLTMQEAPPELIKAALEEQALLNPQPVIPEQEPEEEPEDSK